MGTDHLLNSYRLLHRRGETGKSAFATMRQEIHKRMGNQFDASQITRYFRYNPELGTLAALTELAAREVALNPPRPVSPPPAPPRRVEYTREQQEAADALFASTVDTLANVYVNDPVPDDDELVTYFRFRGKAFGAEYEVVETMDAPLARQVVSDLIARGFREVTAVEVDVNANPVFPLPPNLPADFQPLELTPDGAMASRDGSMRVTLMDADTDRRIPVTREQANEEDFGGVFVEQGTFTPRPKAPEKKEEKRAQPQASAKKAERLISFEL